MKASGRTTVAQGSRKGFTLLEIAVALVVVGIMVSMGLKLVTATLVQQQRAITSSRLTAAEAALAGFASQHQRLPCPADGALPRDNPAAGMERRDAATGDCLDAQARGVLPWRTLAIPEQDATDGHYGRLTYRVAPGLTRSTSMNLSACDPAGAAAPVGGTPHQRCDAACTSGAPGLPAICTSPGAVLAGRGLEVRGQGGMVLASPASGTAAAYVLLSHGPSRGGAYGGEGVLQEAVVPLGDGEDQNRADRALASYYVELPPSDVEGSGHFDDVIRRPSILAVANAAALGPRAH
jgi:prepilin-type N-terminal cleavage/methylation domain-containing protein